MKKKKKQQEPHIVAQASLFIGVLFVFLFSLYTVETLFFSNKKTKAFQDFSQETIDIKIKNSTYTLDVDTIFHTKTNKDTATSPRKNFLQGFPLWLGITAGYPPENFINNTYLTKEIVNWSEQESITPPFEGSINFEQNTLVYKQPKSGAYIDEKHLSWKLYTLLQNKETKREYTIHPRIKQAQAPIDTTYFDILVSNIEHTLNSNLTLINTEFEIEHTLEKNNFISIFSFTPNTKTRRFDIHINENLLYELLHIYETDPVNAHIIVEDTYYTQISPSRRGTQIDKAKTNSALRKAIQSGERLTQLTLTEIQPERTTKDVEELDIQHLVASFTTYYSCCEARTRNIQRFSEKVDGTFVAPKETIHLNKLVGRRTQEEGFEPAGTIVQGVLVETIGGGVSQFATTLFNALYWGGYTIDSHTPHSRYFNRYPEGIEATISWTQPDLVFTNNTDSGMYLQTKATDTSLTVSIFGNNDGRILAGSHTYGNTTLKTIQEGGEQARIVQSKVSEREDVSEPRQLYFLNPDIPENTIFTQKHGRPGFKVTVERTITQDKQEKVWTRDVFYLAEDAEFETSSCDIIPPEAQCTTQEEQEEKKKQIEEFYQKLEDTY